MWNDLQAGVAGSVVLGIGLSFDQFAVGMWNDCGIIVGIFCRRGWQAEALGVLRDGELWQRCAAVAPETAEGLRAALSVLAGDESAIQAAVKVRSQGCTRQLKGACH